jgi:3-(3-hydroxy-phenyl)propionate hydroxylase
MVALSLNMGKVFGTTSSIVGALRDRLFLGLNLVPKAKTYVTGMGWKPMPRYEAGVVVDAITRTPGHSDGRLAATRSRSRSLVSKVDSSGVGVQFPQPWVSTAEHARIRMDDVSGLGWNVLVWGNDPGTLFSPDSLAHLAQLGATLVRVVPQVRRAWTEQNTATVGVPTVVLGDVDGRLKAWFDDRPYSVVFLRPDKFVGAVSLTGEADATLGAVLEAMSFTTRSVAAGAQIGAAS